MFLKVADILKFFLILMYYLISLFCCLTPFLRPFTNLTIFLLKLVVHLWQWFVRRFVGLHYKNQHVNILKRLSSTCTFHVTFPSLLALLGFLQFRRLNLSNSVGLVSYLIGTYLLCTGLTCPVQISITSCLTSFRFT